MTLRTIIRATASNPLAVPVMARSAADWNRRLAQTVNALGTGAANVAVATVCSYAGADIPAGWLECDGAEVSRTDYAALFAQIGTDYGVGDGATTFNVPAA